MGVGRASAVSQASLEIKAQGGFPFGGQAARGISPCGCEVSHFDCEPQGGFPFVVCDFCKSVCTFYAGLAHELLQDFMRDMFWKSL